MFLSAFSHISLLCYHLLAAALLYLCYIQDCISISARNNKGTPFLPSRSIVAMRYAVLVTGPAGAGKSTFCNGIMTHLQTSKRSGHLVNMDPAANSDAFEYEPSIDIRDLITLEDVMEELGYGPNGGLVYCFECVV